MAKAIFPSGTIAILIEGKGYDGEGVKTLAEYRGRQEHWECVICGKGSKCYTFNIFDSEEEYDKGNYETWGFGRDHLSHVKLISKEEL